jgi:uncharacterized membrane protein
MIRENAAVIIAFAAGSAFGFGTGIGDKRAALIVIPAAIICAILLIWR